MHFLLPFLCSTARTIVRTLWIVCTEFNVRWLPTTAVNMLSMHCNWGCWRWWCCAYSYFPGAIRHIFHIFKSHFLLTQYHICCLTSAASAGFRWLLNSPAYWFTAVLNHSSMLLCFCYWQLPVPMPMSLIHFLRFPLTAALSVTHSFSFALMCLPTFTAGSGIFLFI